jgi:hypothetical protein
MSLVALAHGMVLRCYLSAFEVIGAANPYSPPQRLLVLGYRRSGGENSRLRGVEPQQVMSTLGLS